MISKIIQKEKERQEKLVKISVGKYIKDFNFWECQTCKEKFSSVAYLEEHLEIHSTEKEAEVHKQSLINLKEYMEVVTQKLKSCPKRPKFLDWLYMQTYEDIEELTKMIGRYK